MKMKCLLIVILAGCAVKCDENNYYVIEMPNDRLEDQEKPFSVFWNVPTKQCKSKKIPFENLYKNYGILQNKNDSFRGEEISILYDPGLFPALLKNETSGKFKFRNGGVPQEGNLELHLETFKSVLEQSIPDPDFHGVGIIDFESWRPVFRQNFGVLMPYKDISTEIEKKMHWWWPKQWIQAEAKRRFEEAARTFMQTSLSVAKQMRPNALWGYYGFPYCFNMANNKMRESCADKVPEENNRIYWLWSESTALFPSVYSSRDLTSSQLASLIRGRVKEAERVKRNNTPVLPYFWFRYRDGGYLSKEDLHTALETLYKSNASGFIIWGSSNDVNTVSKCKKLRQYLESTLGPAIAAFTKPLTKLQDEISPIPIERTTMKDFEIQLSNKDPEFDWEPPENYAQDIRNYVEEEIKRKSPEFNKVNETVTNVNDSILMDIILRSLMEERNMSKNEMKGLPFVDITTDTYKHSHGQDTSQPVDISTRIVQIKEDTNIFSSTTSLPIQLLNNSQTETEVSSLVNLVTKLLKKNPITQDTAPTTASIETLLNQETSQMSSTEFSVAKLQQNQIVIIDIPTPETTESTDFKNNNEYLSTDFVTQQDELNNEELVSKTSSPDLLPNYDEKLISGISSTEFSSTISQDKQIPILSTEIIFPEFVNIFNNIPDEPAPRNTEDLNTKLITKNIFSAEISTTEAIQRFDDSSDKTFSEEYFSTKLHKNNQNEILDSTTENIYDIDQSNYEQKEVMEVDNSEKKTKIMPITTTASKVRNFDAKKISKMDAENPYKYIQTDRVEFITSRTSDSDITSFDDVYARDSINITAGSENSSTIDMNTEDIPFFNQDTFLDNKESPDAAIDNIFSDKSTHVLDNRNKGIENLSDIGSSKDPSDSTVSPTTELNQVAGAGTRVSVPFRHYLCVFYYYSVVKCLCAVFGMC